MMVTKQQFNNTFAEQIAKVKAFHEAYDVTITVKYVIDMFEEATYIDVTMYRDDEEYDTWNFDLFESKAHTYNASKEIAKHFEKLADTTWAKEVYC